MRQSLPDEVLGALARLIREVRFGSIEIVVHDGRVTQIERREKVRFGPSDSARRE
ncbi:MAG TPA: YezD family protein [Burkholderiales bacterium]|nr:YezD family protein [Burkholderiales bacterium]